MKNVISAFSAILAAVVLIFIVSLCCKNYDVAAYSFVASLVILPIWFAIHSIIDDGYNDKDSGFIGPFF